MTAQPPPEAFLGARAIAEAFMGGLRPDPQMTVSEWANRRRKLPQETTKEHGRYKVERTPYIREVQDNLSAASPVIRTVLMKGAQLGGSETGLNLIGYIIDVAQGPVILVCPTVEMAERHSETRIKPMIRMTPRLKKVMGDPDAKKPGNKILLKKFPGGVLVMTGANSGATLRSLPARYMIWEEPDAYPDDVDGEGSAVDIVAARGFTYGYRRKEFLNCTPKLASNSIIYAEYLAGDQRTYRMPRPHCRTPYAWDQSTFRWDGADPTTAHMVCPHCHERTQERKHKSAMMAAGVWVPKVVDPPRGMARSYYLPSFYSPIGMLSWFEIAKVAIAAETNFVKAKTYHNTYLGLPWTDAADTPDPAEILAVALACPLRAREVPDWACILFAGVDCGVDHIEIGVWAYGPGQKRHLVEHIRLSGSIHSPEQWARLTETLRRGYVHPLGAVLRIAHVFIDRGRWPDVIDPWVRAQDPTFVSGIKGHKMDEMIKPRVKPEIAYDGKPIPNSVALRYFLVNSGPAEAGALRPDQPTEVSQGGEPPTDRHVPQRDHSGVGRPARRRGIRDGLQQVRPRGRELDQAVGSPARRGPGHLQLRPGGGRMEGHRRLARHGLAPGAGRRRAGRAGHGGPDRGGGEEACRRERLPARPDRGPRRACRQADRAGSRRDRGGRPCGAPFSGSIVTGSRGGGARLFDLVGRVGTT